MWTKHVNQTVYDNEDTHKKEKAIDSMKTKGNNNLKNNPS